MVALFGTDGIRDQAFQNALRLENLFQLGQGIGLFLRQHISTRPPLILLGRDTRYSGPLIQTQVMAGLLAQGVSVLDGGVLPTPVLSVLIPTYQADLGIMISASHNPASDNGIKLLNAMGKKLPIAWEEAIEQAIQTQTTSFPGNGQIFSFQGTDAYEQELKKRFHFPAFKVVLDCAHGAFSNLGPKILQTLGVDVLSIACTPDGYNINKKCGALYPEEASEMVKKHQAHFGLCLDGDGDRAIFIDEQGNILDGDKIIAMLAVALKKEDKLLKDTVVSTIMSNFGLKSCLNEQEINLIQTPVGDRHISEQIQKHGYCLGGEPSGHMIFDDHPTQSGDGLFTGLKVLELMAKSKQNLSQLAQVMQTFPQVMVNLEIKRKIPLEELPVLQQALKETEDKLAEHGRVVLRYSGTENLLRIMVEGPQKDFIEKEAQRLKEIAALELS